MLKELITAMVTPPVSTHPGISVVHAIPAILAVENLAKVRKFLTIFYNNSLS